MLHRRCLTQGKRLWKGAPRFTATQGNSEHAGLAADLSPDRGMPEAAVLPINKPRASSRVRLFFADMPWK